MKTTKERIEKPSKRVNSFWWIVGTVLGPQSETYYARQHKLFRYVQAFSWGHWNYIRDEYPEVSASFMKEEI